MKKFFLYIITILLILKIQVGTTGCATIVPPAGGLKDTLAPLLLRATPHDSSRNVSTNKFNFSFDEYVIVENFQQNVIVSPIPHSQPTYTSKLNAVSVRLRDTLEPNTTYTIDFGDAIKDVNEGNIIKNFRYVFSTGPVIDSLSFGGNVVLAETGKTDSTLIVILHRKGEDSVIKKERPRYISKSDGKGNFVFRNLPAGTFYVYALKDDSRTYLYQNDKQLFAFADSPVVVRPGTPRKTLYAYIGSKAATQAPTSVANVKDKRLKYQTTINNGNTQDLLKKFSFQFERPLLRFDSSKVRFAKDTLFTRITGYSWSMDTTKKKLTLNYPFEENTLYHLILDKDFAVDTLKQQLLKADTLSFTTLKSSNYGKLSIRFRNVDLSKNPVLQFVQNDAVVNSFPLTEANFSQPLFLPGEYDLRILYDTNKNGIWDPGQFFGKQHKQPELVKPVERRINVKENWDNEFEITI